MNGYREYPKNNVGGASKNNKNALNTVYFQKEPNLQGIICK